MKYKEIILLKLGEIVLKGLNRTTFEQQLLTNIRYRLSRIGSFHVSIMQSTIYIRPTDAEAEERIGEAVDAMCLVYGVVVVCRTAEVEKDMAKIMEILPGYCEEALATADTFRVLVRRSDKKFPFTSPEIGAEAGGVLLDAFPHLSVDLNKPDMTVYIEIRDHAAYIHAGRLLGAGGMPVGTGGKGLLMLSGGIDSPVAGHMLAKRGVRLTAVHFESPPYTSERARQKVLDLADAMSARCGRIQLFMVNAAPIMEALRDACQEDLFTLLLRRMMMRISCRIAAREGCECVITGESLGQVASQTMKSLAVTSAVCDRLLFRPLIGMDKEEIIQIARATDTFEISTRPFEDCCTVFTPKHPNTKPKLERLEAEEEKLDFWPILEEAIEKAERIVIGGGNRAE
ncbi:MAG: tRNA 4-thiouridine(8) synthase ThiI [Clostridia bacterium]|nr:tRNA 4-thiouridine(8) synthase ThiI [Clostridia bacterium]